jgi:hypothetical protein
MNKMLLIFMPLAFSTVFASDIGQFVGYTIAAKKTIAGYQDDNGKSDSSFEGCNFGRKIIFADQTYLTCTSYSYQYAYRPEAILLVRNGSWIMLVESERYDMRN